MEAIDKAFGSVEFRSVWAILVSNSAQLNVRVSGLADAGLETGLGVGGLVRAVGIEATPANKHFSLE